MVEVQDRIQKARTFLTGVDLDGKHPRVREFGGEAGGPSSGQIDPGFAADPAKNQSVVAGAGIVSFVKGVTAERREAITHSALLAQLLASKQVPDFTMVEEWYRVYFNALTRLGWVVQQTDFNTYEAASDDADVHKVVLEIAAGLLGGTTTGAYLIVKTAVDALTKMDEKSPWISLFHRESQHSHSARFQVALATEGADDGFLVTLLAFTLDASRAITQVLLFKVKKERATLRQYSGKVTIDEKVLETCAPMILDKIRSFVNDYIKELPDLTPASS